MAGWLPKEHNVMAGWTPGDLPTALPSDLERNPLSGNVAQPETAPPRGEAL